MPRTVRPDLPQPVELAVEVFGARLRVALLGAINEHGPCTKAELRRLLGGSEANLHAHLTALEEAGVVLADPRRSDEAGPVTRRYSVDAQRVDALLEVLARAVRPPESR
ncbi:winged helix-turn-helix domain-containing protein [Nocardioides sp. GCM10030258]|uniref:winged helix-turn-helix domain-containing protein n=1 Tax=unclassified Nocardioides TaxID=2615069 RepID=UPI00361BA569